MQPCILVMIVNEEINKYYRENYDLLVKRMKNKLSSQQDAEDVVQEAFTRALQYYESFNPRVSPLDVWFNRILTNCFKRFSTERRLGGLTKNLEDSLDQIEPTLENFISKMTSREVIKLILLKPDDQKEILSLNITFGYKPEEISILTGKSSGYIKKSLNKFLNEMKEVYK